MPALTSRLLLALNNKTPNDVFDHHDNQMTRHLNDSAHNQFIYQTEKNNQESREDEPIEK